MWQCIFTNNIVTDSIVRVSGESYVLFEMFIFSVVLLKK